jgi:hypothetical protein
MWPAHNLIGRQEAVQARTPRTGQLGRVAAFTSEHVETRLPGDAVPKVNCQPDVAGPKGIASAANGDLSAAILTMAVIANWRARSSHIGSFAVASPSHARAEKAVTSDAIVFGQAAALDGAVIGARGKADSPRLQRSMPGAACTVASCTLSAMTATIPIARSRPRS